MKGATAPFFGGDIVNSFGEVPFVTVKILNVVLALAVGLLLRLVEDDGSILSRTLAVSDHIFDAHLDELRMIGGGGSFGNSDASLTSFHLDAMVGDAKTDCEAKSL